MIKVDKNTALTIKNIAICYTYWKQDYARLKENENIYTNAAKLKMPFGKKIVTISAAATLGDGITISAPEEIDEKQKSTFDEIQRLFKKQTIINQDKQLITDMSKIGKSVEYRYMSDDEVPVPKCTEYDSLCAFVVYDNTVEKRKLFGCSVDSYIKNSVKYLKFTVADDTSIYEKEIPDTYLTDIKSDLGDLQLYDGVTIDLDFVDNHIFGEVPFTEILNNKEEQSDFEQVIELIKDRSNIHDKNFDDFNAIAKNYLKGRNVITAGDTDEEKNITQKKATKNQRIEFETNGDDPNDDYGILSKNENYSSITEFGKDIDSKIYDLSMVPDLTSQEFAGNVTGVALELKMFPFKENIKTKNGELEKLYRERLKDYMTALIAKNSSIYSEFDVEMCTITFNRSWTTNIIELGNLISQLKTTGLFSDKYLTNKMPDADYDEEQTQLEIEKKNTIITPDPNNSSLESLNGILRGLNNGDNNANAKQL